MPKFSIVVPAYNAEATLPETLDAVIAQRYGDWECVVVDDGSKDATLRIARDYASRDERMRVLTQRNQGTAGEYNTGVRAANGTWIVVCSADDLLLPEHLAEISAFVGDTDGCDICSTNGYLLRPDGSRELVYRPGDMEGPLSLVDLIRGCFYGVGAAYRREVFDLVGGYRIEVFAEDYDFWLRAMASGARHCYIPVPLSVHRISAGQKSSDAEAALRSDIAILSDLERSGRLSPRERNAVHDSVCGRLGLIARLDGVPLRRQLRVLAVYVSHPASLGRALGRRARSRLHSTPRADR